MRRQPQKIPAKKKLWCNAYMSPHRCHKLFTSAQKEWTRLSEKFKGSEFEIFDCPFCRKFHVGKVPDDTNLDE